MTKDRGGVIMKRGLLDEHVNDYLRWVSKNKLQFEQDRLERSDRIVYYQSWTRDKLLKITREELIEFLGQLWALQIWGNKAYVVDERLIGPRTLKDVQCELAELLWGKDPVAKRWDRARKQLKGIGPATISELLSNVHPDKCVIWNSRVEYGFRQLEVSDIPVYDYQITGKKYEKLCEAAIEIQTALIRAGLKDVDLLLVDYFIYKQFPPEKPTRTRSEGMIDTTDSNAIEKVSAKEAEFAHNDIRDKLADIGTWLGFKGQTEVTIAAGSRVDATWELSIGNMGRVIYVFEVQTKGNLDSLMMNLLKAAENQAVQGIVAVSDNQQIEDIRDKAPRQLKEILKFWDYREVLRVHEHLERVYEAVNSLGLVPTGFK